MFMTLRLCQALRICYLSRARLFSGMSGQYSLQGICQNSLPCGLHAYKVSINGEIFDTDLPSFYFVQRFMLFLEFIISG